MKFKVIRAHTGDRDYSIGETREATLADVQHLIPKTLAPVEEKKSEAPPSNKMEAAPSNKTDHRGKNK
jgi:hypothetical protein